MSKIFEWLLLLFSSSFSIVNLVSFGIAGGTKSGDGMTYHLVVGSFFFFAAISTAWGMGGDRKRGHLIGTDAASRKFLLGKKWKVVVGGKNWYGMRFGIAQDGWTIMALYLGDGDATSSGTWIFEREGKKITGRLSEMAPGPLST